MSGHLSSQQISRWMIGERDAPGEAHVRECGTCRATLAGLETALAQFRQSVWQLSDRQRPVFELSQQRAYSRPLRWGLAAAAVVILAAVPLYKHARDQQRQAEDTLLLDQVNAAVSRSVPRPMEPLIELVQWRVPTEEKENKR